MKVLLRTHSTIGDYELTQPQAPENVYTFRKRVDKGIKRQDVWMVKNMG